LRVAARLCPRARVARSPPRSAAGDRAAVFPRARVRARARAPRDAAAASLRRRATLRVGANPQTRVRDILISDIRRHLFRTFGVMYLHARAVANAFRDVVSVDGRNRSKKARAFSSRLKSRAVERCDGATAPTAAHADATPRRALDDARRRARRCPRRARRARTARAAPWARRDARADARANGDDRGRRARAAATAAGARRRRRDRR